MKLTIAISAIVAISSITHAFVPFVPSASISQSRGLYSSIVDEVETESNKDIARKKQKQALLGLLGGSSDETSKATYDPLLVDPISKEPLAVSVKGPILGGSSSSGVGLSLRASPDSERVFTGRTDVYINLLEPVNESKYEEMDDTSNNSKKVSTSPILSSLLTFTPPPLRPLIANLPNSDLEYVPMRDLFTSPSVSFAYERGWRQGFAAAGFPGPDKEFEMARDYFAPVMEKRKNESNGAQKGTVVDMSCATGEYVDVISLFLMNIVLCFIVLVHRSLNIYLTLNTINHAINNAYRRSIHTQIYQKQ